ncbi:protein translocase subunit SecD [Kordiimonas lacus]|uniref:Protein translocase subunit SecD n=1 Tax=Kordiimonas lacus TaxID=637679 RepID=A0A1G6VTQ5_9PROT|nr:protein translocase subunit SecD [Kordiimonas lacus]SDD56216.1 preprotein translocase subunit SecD [Kordiimonas lacus]
MLTFPRWKIIMIMGVVLLGILTSLPNFLTEKQREELPGFLPSDTLNLGLDLRGGVRILWGAETDDVVNSRLNNIADQVRDIRRSEQGLNFRNIRIEGQSVTAEVTRDDMVETAREKLRELTTVTVGAANPLMGGGIKELELAQDGNKFTLTLTEQGIEVQKREAVARAMEVIRKRVDPDGTKEVTIQPEGNDRIILEVPGADDPEQIKILVGQTAKLTFHDVNTNVSAEDIQRGRVGYREKILPSKDGYSMVIKERVILSGEDLIDARVEYDKNGKPAVGFTFNTSGAKRFGTHTQNNIGRPFAIVLDNEIISAPNIITPILGGQGQITNVGAVADAQELATLLKAGALPIPLQVMSERSVGPDLGQENIDAGEIAAVIGFIGVIIYMILSYGRFGIAASISLITNLVLIMGALSFLQATLTLPGIAGIVLTIGMAVDANVLVFERIREEQNNGRKPFPAMEHGYGEAFSTIMDANITTFIAAAVLYMLGSGPVQGFAVTLAIGILTSMFTAVVLSRFILATWLKRVRPAKLPL